MKRSFTFSHLSALLGLAVFGSLPAVTAHPEPVARGTALMHKVDARPRGSDEVLYANWRLISKNGRERVRTTRSYWLDLREEAGELRSKRLIVFDKPVAIEDTAFLVWSNGEATLDDRRWTYLPALRKARRITGRDRGKAFAGTDFNFEDLSDLGVDEESHRLEGRAKLAGREYWVVASRPRDGDSPYSKRVRWIHPKHFTVHRIEFYDHHDRSLKTLKIDWSLHGEIWTWKRLDMRSRNGHRTVVEVLDARHNLRLEHELFSQHRLRSGPPRADVAAEQPAAAGIGDGEARGRHRAGGRAP